MTLCFGEKVSTGKPAVLIDFSFTVDYYNKPPKSFTSVPFMGWTRVQYPLTWVPGINRHMLTCYLATKCGIDPSRLEGISSLENFKKMVKMVQSDMLFRDQYALDAFYKQNDKNLEEGLNAIEEEDE